MKPSPNSTDPLEDGIVTAFVPGFVRIEVYVDGEVIFERIFSSDEAQLFAESILDTTQKSRIGKGGMTQ